MEWKPKKGYAWNPLRNYPRNLTCFCGQAKKAKDCCLPLARRCVKEEIAEDLRKYIDAVEKNLIIGSLSQKNFRWKLGWISKANHSEPGFYYKPVFKKLQYWKRIYKDLYIRTS